MKRRVGKGNILQRLEALEARSTDVSGLIPHSPEWLKFWIRQVELYMANQEHVPLTMEAVRAYMQSVPDDFSYPVETF
jgi:hypothetical protein